ncbi:hypothetical protein D9C73_006042 [Collichthys lucidus]|uniref:Uncharacterized protein n=1 Tax=Collichthys lucidus TaxID=240159 RepID=A0A4U5UC78_COLLU|nr:hypothetical protein D9C73_006042 [Collichthys lucidus]
MKQKHPRTTEHMCKDWTVIDKAASSGIRTSSRGHTNKERSWGKDLYQHLLYYHALTDCDIAISLNENKTSDLLEEHESLYDFGLTTNHEPWNPPGGGKQKTFGATVIK